MFRVQCSMFDVFRWNEARTAYSSSTLMAWFAIAVVKLSKKIILPPFAVPLEANVSRR
jgi:hypothetical protein